MTAISGYGLELLVTGHTIGGNRCKGILVCVSPDDEVSSSPSDTKFSVSVASNLFCDGSPRDGFHTNPIPSRSLIRSGNSLPSCILSADY